MIRELFKNDKICIEEADNSVTSLYKYHGAVLLYCAAGECYLGMEKVSEGEFYFLALKHMRLEVKDAKVYLFNFFPLGFNECVDDLMELPRVNKKLRDVEQLEKCTNELLKSSGSNQRNASFKITADIYNLIYVITSHFTQEEYDCKDYARKSTYGRIKEIDQYISEHWDENIKLSDLALMNNYSVSAMSRFFTKNFNMTFSEFYNDVRLSKAKNELMFSNLSITEIAEKCGFSNLRSFQRIFYDRNQMTPSEYRSSRMEDKDANS